MFCLRNKKNIFSLGACVTKYHGNNSRIRTFLKVQQLLATHTPMLQKVGWQIPPSAFTGGIYRHGKYGSSDKYNIILFSLKILQISLQS